MKYNNYGIDFFRTRGAKMIQDINGQYDNTYNIDEIGKGDIVLAYRGFEVLAKKEGSGFVFPSAGEIDPEAEGAKAVYLFSVNGKKYFNYTELDEVEAEGFEYLDLRSFFGAGAQDCIFASVTGMQLANWYRQRRYCGKCGARTVISEKERSLVCPECGQTEYPKISPAVIIGITDGDKIVMTKYAEGYSKFALVAGFCEVGESFEDTVRREVMEEVGLKVKNITYYGSQPWSYSDSLMAGFFCEVDGDIQIIIDRNELSVAGWYQKSEIPENNDSMSLTGEMMQYFKNNDLILIKERDK